jgi:hypothetical protein
LVCLHLAVGFAPVLDCEYAEDLAIGPEEDAEIAEPEAELAGVLALERLHVSFPGQGKTM